MPAARVRDPDELCRRLGVRRALNAMGMPTILGAGTATEEVRAAVDCALRISVEIDELQASASRFISRYTGAEAGCVTSSCSAALAVAAAAAMTGADLARISRLPDAAGLPDRVVLPLAHDVNFGAPVSQMIRLSGARVERIGTANHCDRHHLRGALGDGVAAVVYVDSGDVNPAGAFLSLEDCVELAAARGVPIIVDTAAGPDVRPFLEAGADIVVTSAHKQMGAPTAGMICGKVDPVRACYLQNYGIGRAMKVGKEGIVGCIVALRAWYERDAGAQGRLWNAVARILARRLPLRRGPNPYSVVCSLPADCEATAQAVANLLREGDPPVWVQRADNGRRQLWLDLRVLTEDDAETVAERVARALARPGKPSEDVDYHDLYWSERRLLGWPDWK